jgi:hypothetical protein
MIPRCAVIPICCFLAAVAPLRAQVSRGVIRGTVTDSIRARPLAGALVSVVAIDAPDDSARTTTTDDVGAYTMTRMAPGTYGVRFASALLDSLEFGGPTRRVTIADGETVIVDLAIPSGRTLRNLACPGMSLDTHTGALVGMSTHADAERPLGGARVVVAWRELAADSTGATTFVERTATTTSDPSGQFRMCGVPADQWLAVQLQAEGRAGTVVRTVVSGAVGVVMQNLSLSMTDAPSLAESENLAGVRPLTGIATLSGSIRTTNGQALVGAQVRVIDAGSPARTNERGEYVLGALPAGTHQLEVRQLGYAEVVRVVELRGGRTTRADIQLRRAVSLDSIRVIAQRQQYPAFETHRKENFFGTFLDAEQIRERHVVTAADLTVTVPRFAVGNVVGPHLIPVSHGATPKCPRLPTHANELNVVIDNAPYQNIYDIHLDDIGAMEFYSSPTTAPVQFEANCGLIIIWTKAMRARSTSAASAPIAPPAPPAR